MKIFKIVALLIVILIPFQSISGFESDFQANNFPTEEVELFNKFERLDILPPSYELEHIDELMSKDDTIALMASIANWGEQVWIDRTTSFFSRTSQKLKRYFSRIRFNNSFKKQLSGRKNKQLLLDSKRWNIDFNVSELDNVILGWEMLEFEYEVLSKMLRKASLPRTLKDEYLSVIDEVEKVEMEFQKIESEGFDVKNGILGVDEYEKNVWVLYLVGIQHDLLPDHFTMNNFNNRQTPQIALNIELTMYETLLFGEKMLNYIDSLSGYVTGFDKQILRIEKEVINISKKVSSLS